MINLDRKLSEHFTHRELMDPATQEVRLQPGFLQRLEAVRKMLDAPMTITSACRSPETMDRLRREGYRVAQNSFHQMFNKLHGTATCAVDVALRDPAYNGKLIRIALQQEWRVFSYKGHIHLDLGNLYADKIPNEPVFVRID